MSALVLQPEHGLVGRFTFRGVVGLGNAADVVVDIKRVGGDLPEQLSEYRNASRLRDWALRGRGRRTGGVFDLESTLGRRLGVKRDLELTLKSVKNLRCAESST